MRVTILYNAPTLPPDDPDYAQEAGVLESVEAAEAILQSAGHRVRRLGTGDSTAALIAELMAEPVDVVVNFCEGFAGSTDAESYVAGALELLRIPYTGSGPECLSLVRHKARTKWLLRGAGLPTAEFLVLRREETAGSSVGLPPTAQAAIERMLSQGPVIVKPAAEDASLGLSSNSVAQDMTAVLRQAALVAARYGETLVEQFVTGREFNVGIVAVPDLQMLPLAEIEFQPDPALPWNIVTYDAKWAADSHADRATPVRCPAMVEPALAERISAAALSAFRLTGCRDYGRVDLRVNDAGQPFILEINGNPDLGPTAGLARAIRAGGMGYDEFMLRLVETAASRASPA